MSDLSTIEPLDFGQKVSEETRKKMERLFLTCNTQLGGARITVHLEDLDYQIAFEAAVNQYRVTRSRRVYVSYGFLTLEPLRQVYQLNERIDNIEYIFRGRGLFGGVGGGVGRFESFGAATANILLRGGAGMYGATIDLARYDFLMQYQRTLDRLFARHIHFRYRNENHTLVITQTPRVKETVGLKIWVMKRYEELLNDHSAYNWLQRYTLAKLKIHLGEKYSLFGSLPGAQGGTTLKGDALKQAGAEECEKMEEDLRLYADNSEIPLPIRG